jgi:hypothetical protein
VTRSTRPCTSPPRSTTIGSESVSVHWQLVPDGVPVVV